MSLFFFFFSKVTQTAIHNSLNDQLRAYTLTTAYIQGLMAYYEPHKEATGSKGAPHALQSTPAYTETEMVSGWVSPDAFWDGPACYLVLLASTASSNLGEGLPRRTLLSVHPENKLYCRLLGFFLFNNSALRSRNHCMLW